MRSTFLDPQDTIAAVATAPAPACRAIVRLSGPRAIEIALGGFECAALPSPDQVRRPVTLAGRRGVGGTAVAVPCAVALFPGRRTYTGQPLAEIHLVGSDPLVQATLAGCLAEGARLAEPGEFTLRAFLNGRIDLTQAEAVMAVVDAEEPAQVDEALRRLAGGLRDPVARLRERVLQILTHAEATLDFTEEPDVAAIERARLVEEVRESIEALDRLLSQHAARASSTPTARVVLAGPTNSGKSSLFNALAGHEGALVSDRAGTTRDYLTRELVHKGSAFTLIDTAGLEEPASGISVSAQALRASQARQADVILVCCSHDAGALAAPEPEVSPGVKCINVWTKCDAAPAPEASGAWIATSARTGEGLAALRDAIFAALHERSRIARGTISARAHDSLGQARAALARALAAAQAGGSEEFVAFDLWMALDELGKIVGAVGTEEILDRIFGQFCIGK